MARPSRISPCLWFDTEAEAAATFYTSVFDDSRILEVTHYGEAGPRPAGTVLMVRFELEGQEFLALNGGPEFTFDEAISFHVLCDDQAEVDHFWDRLTDGGQESQCGWLKDRFGLSWQIVPAAVPELLRDPDPDRSRRVMEAILGMKKLDVAELQRAAAG